MFSKILLLITPSGMCEHAVDMAVALTVQNRARLYVLCVLHAAEQCWDVLFSTPPPKEAEARKAQLERHFLDKLREVGGEAAAHCSVETTCGFSDVEAKRFAWRIGADLLILGFDPQEAVASGRRNQKDLLVRVSQGAGCPVLIVTHPLGAHPRGLSRILAATDFSRESDHAARYASRLAASIGAELFILHVLDANRPQAPELVEEIRQRLQRHYGGVAKGAAMSRFEVLAGSPKQTIVEYARDADADMIVLAHRRKEGDQEHPDLGSVLAYVAQNAACPTLSVNREMPA